MRQLKPRSHYEVILGRAKASVIALTKRAGDLMEKEGTDAAWKLIFDRICDEGQYVREASVAGLVVYELYAQMAVKFLHNFYDKEKLLELNSRIGEDLTALKAVFVRKGDSAFTPDECVIIFRSLEGLEKVVRSLKDQYQK